MPSSAPQDAAEIVIVGAGAAGSLIAAELGSAGKNVRVLEAGPAWELDDLISSQVAARRLKWGGPVPTLLGTHPVYHNFNSGWGIGGAALHHAGVWLRTQPEEFRNKTLFGRGLDWPLEYDDLRGDYDELQADAGISGDAKAEVWRPPGAPYPNPPLPVFAQSHLIKRGFDALNIQTAPLPTAILSRSYRGRPACLFDGWCDAGCPIQALANPLVLSVVKARKAGVRFQANSYVSRVLTDPNGKRASGVEYFDAQGTRCTIAADTVVLAAYTIQNSLILLNSYNGGLANSSGLVGRYFNCHPMVGVFALFDEETQNHMGTTGARLFSQDGQAKDRGTGPFGSYQWQIGPALKVNDLLGIANTKSDLYGPKLANFLQDASHHLAAMNGILDSLPNAANRIEASGRRDRHGIPVAKVTHSLPETTLRLIEYVRNEGKAIMKAARAREAWTAPLAYSHLSGGTVMGRDPGSSVTNAIGQTHDIPNLYIAGASLFPANGATNPTFTVLALARRTSRYILGKQ